MLARTRILAFLVPLFAILRADVGVAEQVVLVPRYQSGDAYSLVLRSTNETTAMAGAPGVPAAGEAVELRYSALVTVLETTGDGRPLRERHDGVQLGYERPEGNGSLFRPGASLEVRRDETGRVKLFLGDTRLERRIERIVAPLLEGQFEYGAEAALVDPEREVTVGDAWPLDPKRVRRFLRERGVRAIELSGPAQGRLEREADGRLVVAYEIPIAWLEIDEMPANTHSARSEGRYEGRVHLSEQRQRGPAAHASRLLVRMNGVVSRPGVTRAFPWSLVSERSSSQENQPIEQVSDL